MNNNPSTNYTHKRTHNKRISASLKKTYRTGKLKDCIIKMTKDNYVEYVLNGSDASKIAGVSRQQVYQVLSDNPRFTSWKTAGGWKLALIHKTKAEIDKLQIATLNHIKLKTI